MKSQKAIKVTGISQGKLLLISNEFIENSASFGGAIYGDNDLMGLHLINNTFHKNSAVDGGAVYKKSTGLLIMNYNINIKLIENTNKMYLPSVIMEGNQFKDNEALRNGGAVYLNWESIILDKTEFITNKAQNGGAIFFLNLGKLFLL